MKRLLKRFLARFLTRRFLGCLIAAPLWAPIFTFSQPSPPPQAAPVSQSAPGAIVLDVVVTDAHHKPVHKLAASDFIVLENGHPQAISTFEEHNSWEAASPVLHPPELPPGAFTNFSIAPAAGSVNVLLFDLLNTPAGSQPAVRDQVLAYLKQVHPGTRIAIFGLTSKLVLLQGFASDVELLSDVASGKVSLPEPPANEPANKEAPRSPEPVNLAVPESPAPAPSASTTPAPDSSSNDAPIPPPPDDNDEPSSGIGNSPGASELVAALKQLQAASQSTPLTARAHYTLDALNLLAHFLGNLPGRKNLIWFSGSFPINVLPDGDQENPFGVLASAVDEYRETSTLLARSKVAVYPIQAAASPSSTAPKAEANPPQSTESANDAMESMAQATGGEVLTDAAGIQAAIDKALQTGSHYYTLSYTPTAEKEPGDFRKIRVDTSRQGLSLAYRHGYFAAPANPAQPATASQIPYSAMRIAMARGGPDPTEIIFTASVLPVAGDPEPDVAPGNKIGDRTQGPFRRYAVQLGIDAHDLTCPTDAGGSYRCTLEAAMVVYDSDGTALNSAGGAVQAIIPPDQFANILRDGLTFRQDISVPIKGVSFLRIGVHEQSTNKLGTVEFPVSAISKLKPIPVTPTETKPQPAPQP